MIKPTVYKNRVQPLRFVLHHSIILMNVIQYDGKGSRHVMRHKTQDII